MREGVNKGLRFVRRGRLIGDMEGVFPGDRKDGRRRVGRVGIILVLSNCEAERGVELGKDFVRVYWREIN